MNIPAVHQEYERLVKEIIRANEKLLPILINRKFDPQTTKDYSPTTNNHTGRFASTANIKNEMSKVKNN